MVDYDNALQKIGDGIANISEKTLAFFSEKAGTTPTSLSVKLLALFLVCVLTFLATKLTNKLAKFGSIFVGIILAISILVSFF